MIDVLDLAFIVLAAIFTVWNIATLARYVAYRRVAHSSELTWYPPRPWFYNLCLGIGFFMLSLTAIALLVLHRPVITIVAQGLMALYYTVVFPLSFRIRKGFYGEGIWAEGGFVPYQKVRSLSWLEKPELVLIVQKVGGALRQSYARLQVPGDLYGQARRVLQDHIKDRSLSVEKSILGLSDAEASAQEQI